MEVGGKEELLKKLYWAYEESVSVKPVSIHQDCMPGLLSCFTFELCLHGSKASVEVDHV